MNRFSHFSVNTPLKLSLIAALVVVAGCSATSPSSTGRAEGPSVAVVGGSPITLDEFERQYLRTTADSATAARDSVSAFREFLDRYIDFRLKVLEAQSAGYGDRADLAAELAQYRTQLARPYLIEREVIEPLIRQLYERRKEMIDISHILLRMLPDAVPGDTLRIHQRLASIADSIRQGADFGKMAVRHSEDPSAQAPPGQVGSSGRLGYFSAGRMVPEFEDAMFNTPPGEVSGVFRTQFGYHILVVHDRRASRPDLRIAHIMIQSPTASPADTLAAWERLQTAQSRLASGSSFEEVARDLSDDPQTAGRGGDLDFVSYDGWLPTEMRDAIFAADSVGAVVGPVRTRFGWHLMKINGRRELTSFDESYEGLQAEVARLPRTQSAEADYARRLRHMRGVTVDSVLAGQLLGTRSADSLLTELASGSLPADLRARPFLTLADSIYSLDRFSRFVAERGSSIQGGQDGFWREIDAFLDDRAMAYEIDALQERDSDFAQTMTEFREGLMLFRLMEDSVWTAASTDSAALRRWYDAHASEYAYGERIRVIGFYAAHDSLLSPVVAALETPDGVIAALTQLVSPEGSLVRADTTRIEGPSDSVFDRVLEIEAGQHTGVLSFGGGRVVLYRDGVESPRPKTFDEARAEVANAWQAQLEQRLLARLRTKYGVKIHPDVLERAFAQLRASVD